MEKYSNFRDGIHSLVWLRESIKININTKMLKNDP
jgi:hypothetical protein